MKTESIASPFPSRAVQLCNLPCSTIGAEEAASRSYQFRDQVGPETLLVALPAAHQSTRLGSSLTSADRRELS